MEPRPPLNGEFMGESSPIFEWEVASMEKLQAWNALDDAAPPASKSSAQVIERHQGGDRASRQTLNVGPVECEGAKGGEAEAAHHGGDLSPIETVLKKLAAERSPSPKASS